MTLTQNGKDYIANTFGNASKCYVSSGLSWSYLGTDNLTVNEIGGTAQIVSRLILTSLVQSVTYNGQNYTYASIKAANDNTDLALSDSQWIAQNDGAPIAEPQYCFTVTMGSISCTSSPQGAQIFYEGGNTGYVTGPVPVILTNVSAGVPHTVMFRLSGHNDCSRLVTVAAGVTEPVSCTLTAATTNLTTNGKNYIADKFGNASKCYTASGLNYSYLGTDNVTYTDSGVGTAQIVSRLVMTSLVQSATYLGTVYTYAALKAGNDNTDVLLSDAQWVAANDGSPAGEPQYCAPAPTTGRILGNVKSSTGSNLQGATVSDGTRSAITDPIGNYVISNVPAGTYSITVSGIGYNTQSIPGITVTAGYDTLNVDFILIAIPSFSKIELSGCSNLMIGSSCNITAVCKDQYNAVMVCPTLSWSSNNPSVATVSNGIITGVAAGTTTIFAYSGSVSSPMPVIVSSAPPVFSKIELSGCSSLTAGDSCNITAVCKDQYNAIMACPGITWTSSNNSIVIIINGTVIAVGAGTAYIIATSGSVTSTPLPVTVTQCISPVCAFSMFGG